MKAIFTLGFFMFSFASMLRAELGSRNPNEIIYHVSGFYIFRVCSPELLEPRKNCALATSQNKLLPVPIALLEKDYKSEMAKIEIAKGKLPNFNALNDEEKENYRLRYLSEHGQRNLAGDLELYESNLDNPDSDESEINEAKRVIAILQEIQTAYGNDQEILEKIKKPSTEIVPPFNKTFQRARNALTGAGKTLLIHDFQNNLWWRYLGKGDYYDASATRRYERNPLRYGQSKEAEDQHTLGGCRNNFGPSARLPTLAEIRNIGRQEQVQSAIVANFGVDYKNVWSSDQTWVTDSERSFHGSNEFPLNARLDILCVYPTR